MSSIAAFVWFTLSLPVIHLVPLIPTNYWLLMAAIVLAGLFQGATGPVFYELCAELVYPVPESTSGALITTVVNLGAVVVLSVISYIGMTWANTIQTSSAIFSLILVLFMREQYRRAEAEEEMKSKRQSISPAMRVTDPNYSLQKKRSRSSSTQNYTIQIVS